MDDASKAVARPFSWSDPRRPSSFPESGPDQGGATVPESETETTETTEEKKLDRWFLEQKGNRRVPKRLDITNELLVTAGGPLKMTGNITLINEDGSVTHANNLSLQNARAKILDPAFSALIDGLKGES